jgi:hypothetical protein
MTPQKVSCFRRSNELLQMAYVSTHAYTLGDYSKSSRESFQASASIFPRRLHLITVVVS